jgi:hypothetical protein
MPGAAEFSMMFADFQQFATDNSGTNCGTHPTQANQQASGQIQNRLFHNGSLFTLSILASQCSGKLVRVLAGN